MFDVHYQGKLNNTKGCEEDDRNDGQDDPQEEETRFFLWKYKDINTQSEKKMAHTFLVAMMSNIIHIKI